MGKRRTDAIAGVPHLLAGRPQSPPRAAFGGRGRSKFGAVRTRVDGLTFASKAEAHRYGQLCILRAGGLIHSLECQPHWNFTINGVELKIGNRRVKYTADFRYFDIKADAWVIEDVKGMDATSDAKLRFALMQAVHGITVTLVRITLPRR